MLVRSTRAVSVDGDSFLYPAPPPKNTMHGVRVMRQFLYERKGKCCSEPAMIRSAKGSYLVVVLFRFCTLNLKRKVGQETHVTVHSRLVNLVNLVCAVSCNVLIVML